MLPPIDRSQRIRSLATVIRRAVQEQTGSGSAAGAPQHAAASSGAGASTLIQRARAIPETHPHRERQALRLFIESALATELGPQLALDPLFQTLVDDIVTALTDSPEFGADCASIAQMLLGKTA